MKRVEDFTVINKKWLNYSSYVIELEAPEKLGPILPGNFAEIEVANSPKVFLRRPFSFLDVNYQTNTVSFFIKVIGEGTRILGDKRKGDKVNIMYPLGNTFSIPETEKVLIIAGGSGIAPFIMLGRELKSRGKSITFIFGGRTADDIVLKDDFSEYGEVMVTTEDGSLGEKGLVTGHSTFSGGKLPYGHIVACGPEPMMKAVGRIAQEKNIPCEVSLENTMACGFGACLCCIVETVNGNKCVCTEGPVFNINTLKW